MIVAPASASVRRDRHGRIVAYAADNFGRMLHTLPTDDDRDAARRLLAVLAGTPHLADRHAAAFARTVLSHVREGHTPTRIPTAAARGWLTQQERHHGRSKP